VIDTASGALRSGRDAIVRASRTRSARAGAVVAAAAVAWLGAMAGVAAQSAAPLNEYAVKAAFLYNFAKFIEWPAGAFAAADSPVVIGVLGSDPFGALLDDTTRGERVDGRDIVVERLKWDDDLTRSHILFISPSEQRRLPQLIDRLHRSSVLTVGEDDEFVRHGGIIRFRTDDYRIRFAINVRSAERARLKISSKLLSLATIIDDPPGPGLAIDGSPARAEGR
jgi:hypothetical protein